MGKNTDKLYITHSEWSGSTGGGYSASSGVGNGPTKFQAQASATNKLPFWICSYTQQPINSENGAVDKHGHVFDLKNVLSYIRKNSKNPVTGEDMPNGSADLVKLKLQKNS